ncbi:hypothetical protein [Algoriphagus halophytocola]|uniref:Aerotolerance regulator N-terminal domain-containing protein n=1 Tax=Algoriphagus halophytocola TaxID=2991499 RepID=A0ABY6MLX5_9BACT|nr:hypothetical protein [Algoriphagus sp. TR-M5]UZD23984.1 hypothetical protein OM944_05685 [Algoriphagus sp. TR-M5]
MIQFEPLISWPWAYLFILLIACILGIQLYWIYRSKDSSLKKWVKTVLNSLFFLVLITFILQPSWRYSNPGNGLLLYSEDVSKEQIRFWKDSLNLKKELKINTYHGEPGPIYLLGADFSRLDLLKFSGEKVNWIPFSDHQGLSFLNWKAILKQGENQTIYGYLNVRDSAHLKLIQGEEVLAEQHLKNGKTEFKLEFPVQLIGRNELDFLVNDTLKGKIRFYSTAPSPVQYSLKFGFPDPELRFLSQYLTQTGQSVSEEIKVSKSAFIHSGARNSDAVQFLIIDPSQLEKQEVKAAIEAGAAVLLLNLNDVQSEVKRINSALNTDFEAERLSSESSRKLEEELYAAPFEWKAKPAQIRNFGNSLAVQRVGNAKVGVSLLGRTFPIKLAGDSLRYRKIWSEILGSLLPEEPASVVFEAPVFQGGTAGLTLNQERFDQNFARVGSDTLYSRPSLVNPFSKTVELISPDSGWVSLGDTLEYYAYGREEWLGVFRTKLFADFLKQNQNASSISSEAKSGQKPSDWIWYALLLVLLTLLWVEPKILD